MMLAGIRPRLGKSDSSDISIHFLRMRRQGGCVIEPGPGLPAHIALLLNENFDFSDPRLVARRLKSMLRELKQQADFASFVPLADVGNASEFRAVLSGGLDLFSTAGACQAFDCRLLYAEQIARTIALMSDKVTAHDFFYEQIHGLRSRPTNAELSRLVSDLFVLRKLRPLIEAGLLRFTSPFMPVCRSCLNEFESRVVELSAQATARYGGRLTVERTSEGGHIDLGLLYDPPVYMHFPREFCEGLSDDQLRDYFVYQAVRATLWDARSASWVSGNVFSNSPVGVSALLSAEGASFTPPELRAFAAERTANLPWVAGLTVEQTINLRDAASAALPRLREFMARRLARANDGVSEPAWSETVAELREQAQQVRSELELATSRSPSLRRNAAGILGLAVSAACLLAEGPGTALGGLLGTLGLVHGVGRDDHEASLRMTPGYVLVAAQDILAHAQPSRA